MPRAIFSFLLFGTITSQGGTRDRPRSVDAARSGCPMAVSVLVISIVEPWEIVSCRNSAAVWFSPQSPLNIIGNTLLAADTPHLPYEKTGRHKYADATTNSAFGTSAFTHCYRTNWGRSPARISNSCIRSSMRIGSSIFYSPSGCGHSSSFRLCRKRSLRAILRYSATAAT